MRLPEEYCAYHINKYSIMVGCDGYKWIASGVGQQSPHSADYRLFVAKSILEDHNATAAEDNAVEEVLVGGKSSYGGSRPSRLNPDAAKGQAPEDTNDLRAATTDFEKLLEKLMSPVRVYQVMTAEK